MKFARHLKKLYVKKLRYYLVVDMNLPKKDIFTSRNHWKISIKLTDLEIAKHDWIDNLLMTYTETVQQAINNAENVEFRNMHLEFPFVTMI